MRGHEGSSPGGSYFQLMLPAGRCKCSGRGGKLDIRVRSINMPVEKEKKDGELWNVGKIGGDEDRENKRYEGTTDRECSHASVNENAISMQEKHQRVCTQDCC